MYGTPSLLRMSSGEWMWGAEGFFQGDPYARRAHDTLLQAALIQAAQESVKRDRDEQAHEDVPMEPVSETGSILDDDLVVLAFRDDVTIIAAAEMAMMANEIIDEYREVVTGVKENKKKRASMHQRARIAHRRRGRTRWRSSISRMY